MLTMKAFGVRRLQSNGQVSIPRKLVKELELGTGDLVLFEQGVHGVLIKKAEIKEVQKA